MESTRSGLMCPSCEGGQSKELSLSLWREAPFILAKCWRDGCGYFARIPVADGWQDAEIGKPTFKPRYYTLPLTPLTPGHRAWFLNRYRIEKETLERYAVQRAVGEKAFWFPVYGPNWGERGGILRYFDGDHKGPKAVSYKMSDQPWQAWLIPEDPHWGMYVVEDMLSA